MERGATAVKRWSDGDAAEDSEGRPLVNHAITIQGDKAQLTSCADELVNWRSPSC